MACELYRRSPVWCMSLDQGIPTEMDEAIESREGSVCKKKVGQQGEQDGCQGIHYGRIYPRTGILLLCDQSKIGYSHGVWCNCKQNQLFPMGSKLYVAINGKFSYDGWSKDAHGWSRCWGDVLQLLNFPRTGKILRSEFVFLSVAQEGPPRNTSLDAMVTPCMGLVFSPYDVIQGLLWLS